MLKSWSSVEIENHKRSTVLSISRFDRGWEVGRWSTYPRIYLSKVWVKSRPFQTEGRFDQGVEKSTSFNSRLTNLSFWMQWILLESLLDVDLHVVFYMTLSLRVTSVHVQYVLQYGCCWTAPDIKTACTVHIHMYPTAERSTQSESGRICLWSMRIKCGSKARISGSPVFDI